MQPPTSAEQAVTPPDGGTLLLHVTARVRERFLDTARTLEGRPEVRATRTGIDCRDYRSGAALEFYLEADVVGRTVCWWLDATWRGGTWEISGSVVENRDDREYQDQLQELPIRVSAGAELLAIELEAAAVQLLATTDRAEFLAAAV